MWKKRSRVLCFLFRLVVCSVASDSSWASWHLAPAPRFLALPLIFLTCAPLPERRDRPCLPPSLLVHCFVVSCRVSCQAVQVSWPCFVVQLFSGLLLDVFAPHYDFLFLCGFFVHSFSFNGRSKLTSKHIHTSALYKWIMHECHFPSLAAFPQLSRLSWHH